MAEKELDLIQKQIELEKSNMEAFNLSADWTKNTVIKNLFHGIALDSMKHAYILNSILELFSEKVTSISEDERDQLKERVIKHIEAEKVMMQKLEEIIEKTQNREAKFLLSNIMSDEKRHHLVLTEVMKRVVSEETITEAQWWDLLLKDAVARGAPAGFA